MADPTLKDVLKALAELRGEVGVIRGEMASKADVDAMKTEMRRRFDDLDRELTTHAKVHRELEKDSRH
jgi:hypothetical protein